MKNILFGGLGVIAALALTACGPTTLGGQFTEPAYGWQRNGTYILTPAEMEMGCDGLRAEQGKAAQAIAYVDTVRGQKFGQSLMFTGVAAMFGMVRLPDVGFEEQKAKDQLRQGAAAFNVRLEQLSCEPSDIDLLIAEAKRDYREQLREAEKAAGAEKEGSGSRQNFNQPKDTEADDDKSDSEAADDSEEAAG